MDEKLHRAWRIMFAIALLAPTVLWLLIGRFLPPMTNEKREKAEFPEISVENYVHISGELTAFYDDRVPFRDQMISLNSYGIYEVFHEAGQLYVIVGKGPWLFYNRPEDGDNLIDYKGLAVFSEAHKEIAMTNLAYARDKLRQNGCELAVIVVPEKEHVYSEYMPDYIFGPGPIRADDFVFYVKTMLDMPIVYPKAELMMYKDEEPDRQLYYCYDTHWNDLGAYVGTKALYQELGLDNTPIWELSVEEEDDSPYDLANLLSIGAFVDGDIGYRITDPYAPEVTVLNGSEDNGEIMHFRSQGEDVDPRRVVVIRDSFGLEMAPFIADHFAETYLIHRDYYKMTLVNEKILGQLQPDLVIYEISERYLSDFLTLYIEEFE